MTPKDVRYIVTALPMQAGLVPTAAPIPAPPPPPPAPIGALQGVPGTMSVGTPATAQVVNTGTVTMTWGIGVGSGLTVTPNTGTLAPGASQSLALNATAPGPGQNPVSYTLTLTVSGGTATGSPATIVASSSVVAPVPNFIGAPAAGTVPFTTTFTNQSTGTYSALLWDFGDGSTSTSANPTHAYTAAGTYTVTLTLTWAGGTVPFTRTAYITASAAPSATGQQLSGSTTGTTGSPTTLTVTLNGPVPVGGGTTAISAPGATLSASTLTWTFGGPTSQTFTIQRAADGTTSVSLTNSMGLSNGTALSYTSSSVAPPAPTAGAMQFSLVSAGAGTKEFCIGFSFRDGDIPGGQSVVVAGAAARATVMNRWPSGAVKFAVIGGTYNSSAGVTSTVTLSAGTVSAGSSLTAAAAQSAMASNTAAIGAGAFGSVTWSGADFASPFLTHFANDLCAEFIYRKPIGSDAHLVGWIALRLFATGAVEVLPWIENGYLNVAAPTNKSASYTFSLGGSTRETLAIDLPHHSRTPLVSSTRLAHWLAADPLLSVKNDVAYMQATERVPTYFAAIDPANTLVTGLPASFTPLQIGGYDYQGDIMGNTGYASPIGLLPQHDALYLMTTADVSAQVQRNAYSAGRYPIHWRDSSTNRPPVFATYPNLVIGSGQGITNTGGSTTSSYTPAVTGTAPPSWDLAHCPSVGYMAYLLTGRFYHAETAQFAAVANHFHQDDIIRGGGTGVIRSYGGANDTRHAAWGIRSLWQAYEVTPDADTAIRANFKAALQATIDFHHARYVAQTNNPLGFTEPGADYFASQSSTYGDRLWMQDFSVASWGYMKAAQPVLDTGYSAKITAFFNWHAPATVGRLGDPDDTNAWPVNNPAHYNGAVAASDSPDWAGGTGPWYPTFRAAYNATILTPPSWLSTNNFLLGAEILPGANSFLGNLLPAIAYAVRHGASGAQAAYRRLAALQGYGLLIQNLQTFPVWGVRPASGDVPTWLANQPTMKWVTIPNSTMAGSPAGIGSTPGDSTSTVVKLSSFSTLTVLRGTLRTVTAGGHMDSPDNGVRAFNSLADSPNWVLERASDHNGSEQLVAYYASGSPASRHTYRSQFFVPQRNRIMSFGARYVYGNPGTTFSKTSGYNPVGFTFDSAATHPDPLVTLADGTTVVGASVAAFDPVSGIGMGCIPNGGGQITRYDAATNTYSRPGSAPAYGTSWAFDSKRQKFTTINWGDGTSGGSSITAFSVGLTGTSPATITVSGPGLAAFTAAHPVDCVVHYDPINDVFWMWDGVSGQVFKFTPDSGGTNLTVTVQAMSGTAPGAVTQFYSRSEFVPEVPMLVVMNSAGDPMKAVRTF